MRPEPASAMDVVEEAGPPPRSRVGVAVVGLVVLFTGLLATRTPTLNHDVASITVRSARMLDGERLYVDLPEPNPPLVFLLQQVPVAIARALGTEPQATVLAFLVALVLGGVAAAAAAMRAIDLPRRGPVRDLAVVGLLVVATFGAGYDLAQREHLLFVALVPYLIGAAGAVAGRPLPTAGGVAVGVAAAVGLAFKPYFPPIWIAVEAWVLARTRAPRRLLRGENVGIVASFVAYAAYLLVDRTWLDNLALWLGAYNAYGALGKPLVEIVLGMTPVVPIAVVLGGWVARRRGWLDRLRPLDEALLLPLPLLAAAVIVQGKGFPYHALPLRSLSLWAGLVMLAQVGEALPRLRRPLLGTVVVLLAMPVLQRAILDGVSAARVWPATFPCVPQPGRATPDADGRCQLDALSAQVDRWTSPGDPVAILSTGVVEPAEIVVALGLRDVVRSIPLLLPDTYGDTDPLASPYPYHPADRRPVGEDRVLRGLARDLERDPPVLLLFDARRNLFGFGEATTFDLLTFYRQDDDFRERLARGWVEVPDEAGDGAFRWFVRRDVAGR